MTTKPRKSWKNLNFPFRPLVFVFQFVFSHSESVYIETKDVAPIEEVKAAIAAFPGAVLEDDIKHQIYPQAANAVGSRETFVGRIRKDLDIENGIHMWGRFQTIFLKVLLGIQFKLLKVFMNVVLFVRHQN